jgi:hypothetical protein
MHNKELRNLHSSPTITRAMKSRRIRWAGNVVCMRDQKYKHSYSPVKSEGMKEPGRSRRGVNMGYGARV